MTPDVLPILGNGAGDFLCIKFDHLNRSSQIVHWYHGGGDWIPWGRNLAEAIVFDSLADCLPGPGSVHAIAAEDPRPTDDRSLSIRESNPKRDPLVAWALNHLPEEISDAYDVGVAPEELAEILFKNDVAKTAVAFEWLQELLQPQTDHTAGDASHGEQADRVARNDVATKNLNHAEEILCELRESDQELAWVWILSAHAAEQHGSTDTAIKNYVRALACSSFSDQSIRLGLNWNGDLSPKYAAARLLSDLESLESCKSDLSQSGHIDIALFIERAEQTGVQEVSDFWMQVTKRHADAGDFAAAYGYLLRAGWDVGAAPMSVYQSLIESAIEYADKSGQRARAAVATAHMNCFAMRYGNP